MKKSLLLLMSLALLNHHSLASSDVGKTLSSQELSNPLKVSTLRLDGKDFHSSLHFKDFKEVSLKDDALKQDYPYPVLELRALPQLVATFSAPDLSESLKMSTRLDKKWYGANLKSSKSYVALKKESQSLVLLHDHFKTPLKVMKS